MRWSPLKKESCTSPPRPDPPLVVIKGAGDLATGVALSFHAAGFRVVMTELPSPTAIRRTVSFCSAVAEGSWTVEGVRADLVAPDVWEPTTREGRVAVLVDPDATIIPRARPEVVVDAIMAKSNVGTLRIPSAVVVALGPGFVAGDAADAVIETARGHHLGRIILEGTAAPDTGVPGDIAGRTSERILRAPAEGQVASRRRIGDLVTGGELILLVGSLPVQAPFDGCLRGLIQDGTHVTRNMKIGDLDPRGDPSFVHTVSDKARAVGRAALEAALQIGRQRALIGVWAARPSTQASS